MNIQNLSFFNTFKKVSYHGALILTTNQQNERLDELKNNN